MLERNRYVNSEGYCKDCNAPLGLDGRCYPCLLNAMPQKKSKRVIASPEDVLAEIAKSRAEEKDSE